jgi:hypothetical protein
MKNRKAVGETTTSQIRIDIELTSTKCTTNLINFQYDCSFCQRKLPDNSTVFEVICACPKCFKLSHFLVDGLRRDRREYSKRFEVKR